MRATMRIALRNLTVLAAAAALLGCTGYAAAQSSASYQISKSVMSGGGGRSSSASYEMTGTLGQPSPVDVSDSTSYSLGSGFWGGMVRTFTVAIESISYSIAEGVRIAWQSVAGATYTIEYADGLSLSTIWKTLSALAGTGGLMQWLDDGTQTGTPPTAASVLKRFYRLSGQKATP